jgi:hypothetical protein
MGFHKLHIFLIICPEEQLRRIQNRKGAAGLFFYSGTFSGTFQKFFGNSPFRANFTRRLQEG